MDNRQATSGTGSSSRIPAVAKIGSPFSGNVNVNGVGIGIVDGRPTFAPVVGRRQARLPRALLAECSAPLSHVTSTEVLQFHVLHTLLCPEEFVVLKGLQTN